MPPVAKAPKKPQAPKKPSSRSKTGNDACSMAASNWQLAIRGKEPLDPETYKTLGKCRALARSKKQASDFGRTGKLSEQGQKALEGRLQKRFDQGKITQKSRAEELKILLAKRAERAKARAAGGQPKPAETGQPKVSRYNQLEDTIKKNAKSGLENEQDQSLRQFSENVNIRDQAFSNAAKLRESQFVDLAKSGDDRKSLSTGNAAKLIRKVNPSLTIKQANELAAGLPVTRMSSQTYRGEATHYGMHGDNTSGVTASTAMRDMDSTLKLAYKTARQSRAKDLLQERSQKTHLPKETVARLAPTASGKAALRPAREPKPGLTDTKRLIGQVKAKEKAKAENQSGVRTVKTSELKADPERFQYKLNTNATGVTDQFKETKVWNKELAGVVQVWKDPANGQTYVVNGHHRYELASRLGVKNLNVQYIQAANAAEARQKGALTNIAEGRGTSLDAGKFLRDLKTDNPEAIFQQRGISLSEKTASEGLALRNLAAPIWSKVVNEQTPLSRAVAIGKSKLREEDQIQLFNKAEKGQWTSGKTLEFGKELKRAPLVKTSSDNLFGDEEFINVAEQRAALADRFQTRMKTDANLFGKVGRSRNAGRLEQVGSNRIDVTSSQEQAKQAQNAVDMFNIERNYGLVSRTLDKYATGIAGGQKLDKVYPQFERQVSKQLDNILNKEIRDKRAAELRAMNPADRRKLAKRRTARV